MKHTHTQNRKELPYLETSQSLSLHEIGGGAGTHIVLAHLRS